MTTVRAEESRNGSNLLVALLIAVVVLIGIGVWISWASTMDAQTMELLPAEIVPQVNTTNKVAPQIGEVLSASEALATNDPVLFVFVPFEKCSQQYCLTADVVAKKMPDHLANSLYVVEVPVHSFYIYTVDTPPDFIIADWDLYPTEPHVEWMPDATLTEFGWGIAETTLVLVIDGGEQVRDIGGQLDTEAMAALSE